MDDTPLLCAFSTNVEGEAKVTRVSDEDPAPSDIVINSHGQYVVVDSEAAVLRFFASDGSYLHDAGAEHLNSAWGLLTTNSGKLVVSDPVDQDLKVFSKSGNFLASSEYGTHLLEPYGIAYHEATCRVAVADRIACCVYVHDPEGKVRDVLKVDNDYCKTREEQLEEGQMEKGQMVYQQMQCPSYVTFAANGDVIVTDMETHCIYRFAAEGGELLWVYDGSAPEESLLSCPCGVVVDSADNTLVADSGNSRVIMLNPEGHFFGTTLGWESGILEPRGLRLHQGHLVVTEGTTGIVKVFDYDKLKTRTLTEEADQESYTDW